MRAVFPIMVLAVLVSIQPSEAALATFDSLEEGFHGQTLVDGGITFFDVDAHLSVPSTGQFSVDDVSETVPRVPAWENATSLPNWLGMLAYQPGTEGGFTRFGELKMTTGQVESLARVDVLHDDLGLPSESSIVLEAYLDDQLIATDHVDLGFGGYRHDTLTISNVNFDTLRLRATGPVPNEAFILGGIDNVLITPEPTTALLLLLTILLVRPKA